ncbi:MAG: hypothetical protein J0L66_06225 [Cytophagales bacterium]|nr:hypothetical protein [Cytophagales bacterium]
MKTKEYFKELSLTILGVFIALVIDNYREDVRDDRVVKSYLGIIKEDLSIDIQNLTEQLKGDSSYVKKLGILSDVLTTNRDLPQMKFGLSMWTSQNLTPYRKLSEWDSLDYYSIQLYENSQYKTRKIGFSTIINSGLGHKIDLYLLKKITIYYTTDSDELDYVTEVDDNCHWLGIEYANKYQGSFKNVIMKDDFNATQLRNEVSGRYNTTLTEMHVKIAMLDRARELLKDIEQY